jgi:hypothetical protein
MQRHDSTLIEKDVIVFCVWVWIFMGGYEGSSINEDVQGQLSWLWQKCTSTCDRQSMITCVFVESQMPLVVRVGKAG